MDSKLVVVTTQLTKKRVAAKLRRAAGRLLEPARKGVIMTAFPLP
jgi:hypothetical protein